MIADTDAVFEREREVARRWSDMQWEMAQILIDAEATGSWRERYVTFDQFVMDEMRIYPGMARELMWAKKRLNRLEIDAEVASIIGYVKVRTVAGKMQPENCDAIVKDLETETLRSIRQKYCPVKPRNTLRQTPCGPKDQTCTDPHSRPACCTGCGVERGPVSPDTVKASVVKTVKGVRRETVSLKRKPGVLEWTDTAGQKHPTGLLIDMNDTITDAILVARRHWGRYDDHHCVDGICGVFVSAMGTDEEKERILSRLQAEQDRAGQRLWDSTPCPTGNTRSNTRWTGTIECRAVERVCRSTNDGTARNSSPDAINDLPPK